MRAFLLLAVSLALVGCDRAAERAEREYALTAVMSADRCVAARKAAQAWLERRDEGKYRDWLKKRDSDCFLAGMGPPPL